MGRYIKKAKEDLRDKDINNATDAAAIRARGGEVTKTMKPTRAIAHRRSGNIDKAVNKLTGQAKVPAK